MPSSAASPGQRGANKCCGLRVVLLGGLLVALCGAPARALDPTKHFSQYSSQTWQLGLPNASVSAILQTRDGYLWVGTQDGLARFDGVRFTAVAQQAVGQLGRIEQLLEDVDGTLWVLGRTGLLALRGDEATLCWRSDGSPIREIRGMREDAQRRLWLATDAGLARVARDRVALWPTGRDVPRDARVLWAGRDGRVRVLGASGVQRIDASGPTAEPRPALPGNSLVLSAHEDRRGTLWIGTEAGLFAARPGHLQRFSSRNGLCADRADGILEDGAGNLWIQTPRGLSRSDRHTPGLFRCFGEADGLADVRLMALYEDREGSLWIGMDTGGLMRVSDGACTTYTTHEGLSDDAALCVLEDRRGDVWIGTQGGLNRLRDGHFRIYTTANGLSHASVRTLAEGVDGSLWIGTHRALNRLLPNGRIEVYDQRRGLSARSMRAVLVTRDGSLWVGTEDGGLNRLRGGRFESLTTRDGLSSDQMGFLFEDRRGRLWAGTFDAGVNCIDGGKITRYTTGEGLSSNRVRCMFEDQDGALWFGTNGGGLSRLRDGAFATYGVAQGLPDSVVYQILPDAGGRLWMSSNKGIFAVRREAFDALDRGELKTLPALLFDSADGMKNQECKGRFQPPGARARDGRMWFPTRKGVVVIDPEHLPRNPAAPSVAIERVVVDQDDVDPRRDASLPPGRRSVVFQYTGLSFVAPARLRFRYRLVGVDPDWVEAGTDRVARYRLLPPGRHTFEVVAANDDGVWSTTPATFRFALAPRFYQTKPFYAVSAASLLAAAWMLHRLRLRQAQARFAAVLAERGRIARELHDTLMQDFTGVTWQLHAIAEGLSPDSGALRERINGLIARAQSYLADARRSVLDLREQPSSEHEGLAQALEQRVRGLTAAASLAVDFRMDKDVGRLAPELQRQVLRIAQEAVANAVRHAHARRLEVELTGDARSLRLRLRDDGCGFEAQAGGQDPRAHFGLIGMDERARQIGGRLTIASAPGAGTEVTLEIPTTPDGRASGPAA